MSPPAPPPAGSAAEELVARALEARGWRIVARRLRMGRLEVDLVARRDDVVAVVEVRGRRAGAQLEPFDTIDAGKRRRLARAARALWSHRFSKDESVRVLRIDVAAVTWGPGDEPKVEIAEGAIDPAQR